MDAKINFSELDAHGFMKDYLSWTREWAVELAADEQLTLTPAHYELIDVVRAYYQVHQSLPKMRGLVSEIRRVLGEEKGKSQYLLQLFPVHPLRQLARVAGLPKPPHCV